MESLRLGDCMSKKSFTPKEEERIRKEFLDLPRTAKGNLITGGLNLLARKWGTSKSTLVKIIKGLRGNKNATK